MNARIQAFQHSFIENRKPKFETERESRSASPPKKYKQKTLDYTFNSRIDKSSLGTKRVEGATADNFSGLDSVVRKILKAPASEQRLSPLEKVIQNEPGTVRFRDNGSDSQPILKHKPQK